MSDLRGLPIYLKWFEPIQPENQFVTLHRAMALWWITFASGRSGVSMWAFPVAVIDSERYASLDNVVAAKKRNTQASAEQVGRTLESGWLVHRLQRKARKIVACRPLKSSELTPDMPIITPPKYRPKRQPKSAVEP